MPLNFMPLGLVKMASPNGTYLKSTPWSANVGLGSSPPPPLLHLLPLPCRPRSCSFLQ